MNKKPLTLTEEIEVLESRISRHERKLAIELRIPGPPNDNYINFLRNVLEADQERLARIGKEGQVPKRM